MVALFRSMEHELRIMVFIILSIILYSLFLPQNAFAQTVSSLPTTVSPTSPLYTDLLVSNLFHTFSCLGIGQSVIGQPCLTYQLTKNAQGMIQGVPVLSQVDTSGGVLGTTTSLIGMLYTNPPVRTVDYLASVGKDLGIVKEANAQVVGSGAQVLNPILGLWTVSRNISYIIMIIIFVVIGLMVMFRTRINPQTVITAQAALPGLVIGLILITFSYFFAGLITDTAFIGTNLVGYYFQTAQKQPVQSLVEEASSKNVIDIISALLKGIKKDDIASGVGALFTTLGEPNIGDTSNPATLIRSFASIVAYQIGSQIGPAIGASIAALGCGAGTIWTGPGALLAIPACAGVGQSIGGIGGGLFLAQQVWSDPPGWVGYGLWVVAIVIIVYSMLKLLLRLINNFLTIIFLTITAPFQFMAAALPGRQGLATGWILDMLANVLAFPAVIAVLYFVAIILGQSAGPLTVSSLDHNTSNTIPPTVYAQDKISVVDRNTFPLLGGLGLGFINVLLAFGALVAVPAVPDIIARTIGKASQAGQLIGQEISGSTKAGQGYLNQSQGALGNISRDVSGLEPLASQPASPTWDPGMINPDRTVGGFRYPRIPGLAQRAGRAFRR